MKEGIDFGKTGLGKLFMKMLLPTLMGMLFSAVFIITDGIFVGRGIGSDALAAVNIVAPVWLFATGVGLMFGMGASVIASIYISRGKVNLARVNMTQAILVSTLFLSACSAVIMINVDFSLKVLGCSEALLGMARSYLLGFVPFMALNALLSSSGFFVRLDGAPNYAMVCNVVAAVVNIVLDYVFIFVFKWGIFGAAIATSLGSIIGVVMMLAYLSMKKHQLHFVSLNVSRQGVRQATGNVWSICKLGASSFLCETAVSCMMLCGNYVFIRDLGEAGVAAFSIACYFFPIIFMLYSGIAQAVQPIISYNFGINAIGRVKDAFILALKTAIGCGITMCVITFFFSGNIVSMFIESSDPAYEIARNGLPLFAIGFVPFAVSIISIGYYQSVEQVGNATVVTLLRGFVFIWLSFALVPVTFGVNGIWLATPVAEFLAMGVVLMRYKWR